MKRGSPIGPGEAGVYALTRVRRFFYLSMTSCVLITDILIFTRTTPRVVSIIGLLLSCSFIRSNENGGKNKQLLLWSLRGKMSIA